MLKLFFTFALLVATASSSNIISNSGCQCTNKCKRGQISSFFTPTCKVDHVYCGGKTSDQCKDKISNAVDSVWDSVKGLFTTVGNSMATNVRGWNTDNFHGIDKNWIKDNFNSLQDQVSKFTKEQLGDIDPSQIKQDGWNSLKSNMGAVGLWAADKIKQIPIEEMASLTAEQLKKIPVEKITSFAVEQLQAIPYDRIGGFMEKHWTDIPIEKLTKLSWETLQQIPYDEVGVVLKGNWDKVPVETLIKFTGEQINKIPADELVKLQDYWNKVPVGQVAKFTAEMLTAMGVENLDAEKIGQVANSVWTTVPAGQIAKLSARALQAIDYDGLAAFTDEQWKAVPLDRLLSLTGEKVRAIPSTGVHNWTKENWAKIPVQDMIMFTGDQINNAAVLSKLSTDALFEFAKTGDLDMSLLTEEAKNSSQLDELIKQAGGKEALEAAGMETIQAIEAYEDAHTDLKTTVLHRAELENKAGVTSDELTAAAEAVKAAEDTLATKHAEAAEEGYIFPEVVEDDEGSAGTLAASLATAVLLAAAVA